MTESLPPEDLAFARFQDHGDMEALGEVFDRVAPALLGFARGLLADPQHAEDVVQHAFVVAIEARDRVRSGADSRGKWDGERRLLPWLLGVVAHRARNLGRRERLRRAADLPTAAGVAEAGREPAEMLAGAEVVAVVQEATDELPEPYGPVLDLHLNRGMSAAEIARTLRRPAVTVRSQIRRGMQLLRAALPAGITAAAASVALPAVALASVRKAVLERGSEVAHSSAAAGTGAVAPGAAAIGIPVAVLLMNKTLLVVSSLAVLLAAVAYFGVPWRASDAEPESVTAAAAEAEDLESDSAASTGPSRVVADLPPRGPSVPSANRSAADMAAADLLVSVRQDWNDAPADLVTVSVPASAGEPVVYVTAEDGVARCPGVANGAEIALPDFDLTATVTDPSAGLEFRVPPRLDFQVIVRGSGGRPVAGAEVFQYLGLGSDLHRAVLGVTGADGRLRVRTARPMLALRARLPGHLPGRQRLVTVRRAPRGLVELEPGDAVPAGIVEVVDGAGRSIDAARLQVFGLGARPQRPWLATTGRHGSAELDLPTDVDLLVLAMSDADGAWRYGTFEWPAPRTGRARVVLRASARLSGRVTDRAGNALGGLTVRARWQHDRLPNALTRGFGGTTTTADDGTYSLTGLMPGKVALTVTGRGVDASTELALSAGNAKDWSPVVATPEVWRLRLEDPAGAPLRGWLVEVRGAAPEALLFEGLTDGEGVVELPVPATAVSVRARGRAVVDGQLGSAFDGSLQQDFDHVMPAATERLVVSADRLPTARLRGVLTDARGMPVEEAPVQLLRFVDRMPVRQQLRTDSAGRFELGPTGPGSVLLSVTLAGDSLLLDGVELVQGRTTDLGVLRIGAGARLRVRLVGASSGEETARDMADEVVVPLRTAGAPPLQLRRDSEGVFVTQVPLTPGEWVVEWRRQGELLASRRVHVPVAGSDVVDVRLAR